MAFVALGAERVSVLGWREVASGARRGLAAGAARVALRAASGAYAAAVYWRNRLYDLGWLSCVRVEVPLVSVGNLTAGGTGKTPTVEWHARWFRERGWRVAIVSRGYRAEFGGRNDEALELAEKLPDVPHVQNADRVAAARNAIERHRAQVLIMDDGFQHRRLARDLDLVLLDALEPFGFGYMLPRGLLREPVENLRRADAVLLTRSDLVSSAQREEICQQVRRLAPGAIWLEGEHRPQRLLWADAAACASAVANTRSIAAGAVSAERAGAATAAAGVAGVGPGVEGAAGVRFHGAGHVPPAPAEDPTWLRGRRVAAFCGIGNPGAFRRTLERCGCEIVAWRAFPDHHGYSAADLAELARWADAVPADAVVCTHKDLVKLRRGVMSMRPLAAVVIGLEIVAGLAAWEARLSELRAPEGSDRSAGAG